MNYMMAMELAMGIFMGTMLHDFAWMLINKLRGKK